VELIGGEELCGGCGCICGEGHRHFNQKCGTECQLIWFLFQQQLFHGTIKKKARQF